MKKINRKKVAYILMLVGIVLLLVGIGTSISLGAKNIDLSTIVNSILHDSNDINTKIIRDVRIPRAIAAALVGGFLAVAGAIMQGITRNPIAEPSVMGITQGATFMIAVALVIQRMFPDLIISSFTLISLAMGISMYFNLSQQLTFWISGGVTGAKWSSITLLAIIGGGALIGAILMAPKITILSLGEEIAIGLGQKTNKIRFISILLVILLTGASVSVAGNIVFVGLIIPQIVRGIVGADYKYIIPSSMVFGSVLLVYSDILARMINPPYETPIGSLTALLGVPVFIYLVRKDTK